MLQQPGFTGGAHGPLPLLCQDLWDPTEMTALGETNSGVSWWGFSFDCSYDVNKSLKNYAFNNPYLEEPDGSHNPQTGPSVNSQCGKSPSGHQACVLHKKCNRKGHEGVDRLLGNSRDPA